MDFYRIKEEYNQFLQKYEKEKEALQRYLTSDILIVINLLLEQFYR